MRWEFREHESEYQRLLAKKGPGVQLGQQIAAVDIEDRELAIAIAHHFLDRFAGEAAGRMSLEIHIHPPEKDIEDESVYRVPEEVVEEGRKLGIEADVEQQIKRMAKEGTPYHKHPGANLRHGRFVLKVEGNDVVRLDLAGPPDRPGRRTR